MDVLDYTTPFFGKNYSRLYLFLVKYLPWLWGFGWYFLDIDLVDRVVKGLRRINNALCCKGFEDYLLAEGPDLVLTTHFLPNEIITRLKRKRKFKTALVTCITDYYPHVWWRDEGVDLYITPNEDLTPRLVKLGILPAKIKPLGIPIDRDFAENYSKTDIRNKLGLDPERLTLLITSGGFGVGPVKDLLAEVVKIKFPLQILVVCGNNTSLQEDLKAVEGSTVHNVRIMGFVRNMHELMAASDLMVSKSGGLTSTEAMAKGLPMVILYPIPGQESSNCDFLLRHEAGVLAADPSEAAHQIEALLADTARLQRLQGNMSKLGKPHSAREIVEYVRKVFLAKKENLNGVKTGDCPVK